MWLLVFVAFAYFILVLCGDDDVDDNDALLHSVDSLQHPVYESSNPRHPPPPNTLNRKKIRKKKK